MFASEDLSSIIGKSTEVDENNPNNLQSAGLVGGGTMGQGIAQMMAGTGIDVVLLEKSAAAIEKTKIELAESMDREIEKWGMTVSEKRAVLSRVRFTTDMTELESLKLIIEAIPENFELKARLFKELDELTEGNCILVSNTSTLSLSEIAAATAHPEKIIGVHFMNPVKKTKLVEIIRGLKTSEETYDYIRGFAERINKTAVEVYEYPGYVTTRILISQLNEAMHVLMEGVATADGIDTAMKLGFNFDFGPLEYADIMGLDEVMKWMETLFHELGDLKYRPCPLLRKMVRAGHLGKKTGQGFYKYDKEGKKIKALDS